MATEKVKWSDLKAGVRESRRQLASLAVRVPTNFSFRKCLVGPQNQPVTRIYFLGTLQVARENTLLYVDIPDDDVIAGAGQLTWSPLIESNFQPGTLSAKVSKEEQLMLERKRLSWSWGIAAYDLDANSGKIVFPSAGSLYGCLDHTKGITKGVVDPVTSNNADDAFRNGVTSSSQTVTPHELRTSTEGARLNATICPHNPNLVAFVCNGDLWLHNNATNQEVRVTYCHQGESSSPISAGLPAYITQEEFSRYTGFWWRPFCDQEGRYMILYEEVDESEVELVKFPTSMAGDVEEFRFPKAGSNNAHSSLKMARFRIGSRGEIYGLEPLELRFPLESVFPWLEYLVRAGWTPDGNFIWVQLLNRRQQLLQLILIPLDHFVPREDGLLPSGHENGAFQCNGILAVNSNASRNVAGNLNAPPSPTSLPTFHVICTSKSDTWINVTDILEFFPSDDPTRVRFIWASEETGWRHLYLITAQLFTTASNVPIEDYSDYFLRPHILTQIALTSGEWTVIDKPIKVDWSSGFVYFHGLKDSPLEKHLYVVSIQQPGVVKRLTEAGFSHSTYMDDSCSLFLSVFSSIQSLPACQIFRLSHVDSTADGVIALPIGWLLAPTALDKNYQPPELFSHVISSGDTLHGMIFKPHNLRPGTKYPVMLNIYGGPEVQLVSNTFKGMRQMRSHLLASQGYCVVCIDSRGSHFRGVAFESHLRLKMGQLELSDQVEVLTWLASVTDYLDMDRVAIHGWSYGGYLSLMGLVQFPEIFKVAVAGAPVTDWSLYDTAYTERYMDLPENNPSGYYSGSVLTHGNDFPDEPNRLLIVHGMMDENVHFFQHTVQLISLFISCGKPYQLQIYPGERHSLRHFDASEHFETTLLSFLKDNL